MCMSIVRHFNQPSCLPCDRLSQADLDFCLSTAGACSLNHASSACHRMTFNQFINHLKVKLDK